MAREVTYRRGEDVYSLTLEGGQLFSAYRGGRHRFRSLLNQDLRERAQRQEAILRRNGFIPQDGGWETLFALEAAIGVDIDGTLARRREGPEERGPFEFARVGEDLVNEMVAHAMELFRVDGLKVILLSGRQEEFRPETEAWLKANDLVYDDLIMRPIGDRRRDDVVKRELYLDLVKPFYDIRVMFDDRKRVVDMWRDLGEFPCWQVAPGDF